MSTYKKEIKYTYVFLKCIQLLKDATEIFSNRISPEKLISVSQKP